MIRNLLLESGLYNKPLKEENKCKKIVDELLQKKLIRPSKSKHTSPAFLVEKHSEKKRGKPRMVINYIDLNNKTEPDGYMLPNMQELLVLVQRKKYFSTFDCVSGFWQIELTEECRPLTAFSCPQGHFEWNVLPFGLKQAPGIYQRYMDTHLRHLRDIRAIYVDDIIVYSETLEKHYEDVTRLIRECKNKGIILSKKKAVMFKEKINNLGITITKGTHELQNHILEKIQAFPDKIEDKKQLQRFLGCLTYADQYIENLAKLRKPLQEKLKKDVKWNWTSEDEKYISYVKTTLVNLPVLYNPDSTDEMILETDASTNYWGAVLKALPKENLNAGTNQDPKSATCSGIEDLSPEKQELVSCKAITIIQDNLLWLLEIETMEAEMANRQWKPNGKSILTMHHLPSQYHSFSK